MVFQQSMFSAVDTSSKNLEEVLSASLTLVKDEDAFNKLMTFLNTNKLISFDIETESLSPLVSKIVGFSVANAVEAFYVPIAHKLDANLDFSLVSLLVKEIKNKELITHNGKFDFKFWFKQFKDELNIKDDTFIMLSLIDSDRIQAKGKLKLKPLVKEFFNYDMLELEEDLGTTDFSLINHPDSLYYAAPDALFTYRLYDKFKPKVSSLSLDFVYNMEIELLRYVAKMELNGVLIDLRVLYS